MVCRRRCAAFPSMPHAKPRPAACRCAGAQTSGAVRGQPAHMTFLQEITDLKERIARAQSKRDAWRASGLQEKYLEAHSLTEALELQLERLQPRSEEHTS